MGEKRGTLDRAKIICYNHQSYSDPYLQNSKKYSKKGQITIFMLIGLIILFAAGIYFYYNSLNKPTELMSNEIIPVKSYVEACLHDISKEGVLLMGQNGGYINFPDEINNNPNAFLASTLAPNIKNPYWWYRGKTAVPPLNFLKKELVDYINDNFEGCINEFIIFDNQFKVNKKGKFTATVDFTEEDVKINLDYPLDILNLQNNSRSNIDKFFIRLPLRVKKIHELASKITDINTKTKFLEYRAIDLVSMDQSIPTTDYEISCTEKKWLLKPIENKIKKLLEVNLPYIRVKGTSYNKDIYVPLPSGSQNYSKSYYQNHYIMDIGEKNYEDMHIAFIYDPAWNIQLVARPSDGRVLKSKPLRGQNLLSFFCMQLWHFTYDFEFPVKVAIVDDRTENHDQYSFNFALLPSINHMEPNRQNLGNAVFEAQDIISNDEFCEDLYNNVEILTDDSVSKEPVKGVNLILICGSYYCPLGQTEMFSLGAAAGIRKKMPLCSAGYVEVSDINYESKKYPVQTDYESSQTILLDPVKNINNIIIVKHSPIDYSKEIDLDKSETASISISIENEEFNSYIPYPINFNLPLKFKAKKDYTYNIEIYLVKGDDFTGAYTAEWTVPWEDLENADTIKFHVVESALGEKAKTEFLAKLPELSKKIPLPELIKEKKK